MDAVIRNYRDQDRAILVESVRGIQACVFGADPTHCSRPPESFDAEKYVDLLLAKVADFEGEIFIAESDGTFAGCVVGIIRQASPEDLIDLRPFRHGRIYELFIAEAFRKNGIARKLVVQMESYFRQAGCTFIELGCAAANMPALQLYRKLGYAEKNIEFCKSIAVFEEMPDSELMVAQMAGISSK